MIVINKHNSKLKGSSDEMPNTPYSNRCKQVVKKNSETWGHQSGYSMDVAPCSGHIDPSIDFDLKR